MAWNWLADRLNLLVNRLRGAAIFISHSSKDMKLAIELKRRLTNEMKFREVFLDSDSIYGGNDWEAVLHGSLKRSRAVILLLSERSRDSKWCFAEIVISRNLDKIVIPVVIDKSVDKDIDILCRPKYQYIKSFAELVTAIQKNKIDPREDLRRIVRASPFVAAVTVPVVALLIAWAWGWADSRAETWLATVKAVGDPWKVAKVLEKNRPFGNLAVAKPLSWWIERHAIAMSVNLINKEIAQADDLTNSVKIFWLLDGPCKNLENNSAELAYEASRDKSALQAANLVIALAEWRRTRRYDRGAFNDLLRSIFKGREDNRLRSYLIARMAKGQVDPGVLTELVVKKTPDDILYAVILALGGYGYSDISSLTLPDARHVCGEGAAPGKQPIGTWLLDLRMLHPSRGVHGAADWFVRKQALEKIHPDAAKAAAARSPIGKSQWRLTPEGVTLVLIDPNLDVPRSLRAGPNKWAKLPKFFIASGEITRWQYYREGLRPEFDLPMDGQHPRMKEDPFGLTWAKAALFCNELGDRASPTLKHWYKAEETGGALWHPSDIGTDCYRLPTEIEWEIAARAGSATMRFYGYDSNLLVDYAWIGGSSPYDHWACDLMPNPFGLFDVYGGAAEWCQGPANEPDGHRERAGVHYPSAATRIVRGGGPRDNLSPPHSKTCTEGPKGRTNKFSGIRVARTAESEGK